MFSWLPGPTEINLSMFYIQTFAEQPAGAGGARRRQVTVRRPNNESPGKLPLRGPESGPVTSTAALSVQAQQ